MPDVPNFIRRKASDRTHFVGCCARFSSGHSFCFGANPVFCGAAPTLSPPDFSPRWWNVGIFQYVKERVR